MNGQDGKAGAFEQLRARFHGAIRTPWDADYARRREIFNAMIEDRPAAIAECADVEDVRRALGFAREHELEIAVRGGGHSVAGASLVDGGLVIDMRRFNHVSVDPAGRLATVGGGTLWGEFDGATRPYHLATTGGRVSTTGVAGLTLGGGSGWMERKWGLACDSLVSVDLLTASGSRVSADAERNPELFWALHGGGGNFGIATSLTFRLHEIPEFSMALLIWPAERGRAVAGEYRDFIAGAPDEISGGLIYLNGPPEEFVPAELVDALCCAVLVTFMGNQTRLRELIRPLLGLRPAGELIDDIDYADLQSLLDDPPGYRNYWSAEYMAELPDEALDRFCARAHDMPVPSPSQHVLFPWGGAVAADGVGAAMSDHSVPWVVHPFGLWSDPATDESAVRWVRELRADMRPWSTGAVYLNFIGDEGEDRVRAGYGEDNYRRLARVKAEYDPDNVFNRWHDILPATAPERGTATSTSTAG
ncbi:FAD/FMN-containing dehydrogenase [Actinopolyspora xinjiangensis]|uniref:FAD/FMN-containing dehydrogenase n=1 Tax=Actinopolyspora xinjiangensis TaxID=405564 RepID=A0A1H0TF54_9ACTN|nr:FAD-binding oxidoreductase [Actinopolyspora xinjiangensis]SDP52657.1 FAD/FMN-containing dehydrogenase [Actinopolyspora xinjiangensis]